MKPALKPEKPPLIERFRPRRKAMWVAFFVTLLLIVVAAFEIGRLTMTDSLDDVAVIVEVNRDTYQVNEVPRFTIINTTSRTLHVPNNCPDEPLNVFRSEGGKWLQVHDQADSAAKCQYEPRSYVIAPKARVSASYLFWPRLFSKPGRYRIEVPIEGVTDRPRVEFDVVSATQK